MITLNKPCDFYKDCAVSNRLIYPLRRVDASTIVIAPCRCMCDSDRFAARKCRRGMQPSAYQNANILRPCSFQRVVGSCILARKSLCAQLQDESHARRAQGLPCPESHARRTGTNEHALLEKSQSESTPPRISVVPEVRCSGRRSKTPSVCAQVRRLSHGAHGASPTSTAAKARQ